MLFLTRRRFCYHASHAMCGVIYPAPKPPDRWKIGRGQDSRRVCKVGEPQEGPKTHRERP